MMINFKNTATYGKPYLVTNCYIQKAAFNTTIPLKMNEDEDQDIPKNPTEARKKDIKDAMKKFRGDMKEARDAVAALKDDMTSIKDTIRAGSKILDGEHPTKDEMAEFSHIVNNYPAFFDGEEQPNSSDSDFVPDDVISRPGLLTRVKTVKNYLKGEIRAHNKELDLAKAEYAALNRELSALNLDVKGKGKRKAEYEIETGESSKRTRQDDLTSDSISAPSSLPSSYASDSLSRIAAALKDAHEHLVARDKKGKGPATTTVTSSDTVATSSDTVATSSNPITTNLDPSSASNASSRSFSPMRTFGEWIDSIYKIDEDDAFIRADYGSYDDDAD